MGCGSGKPMGNVDKQMEIAKIEDTLHFKVLFLGAGESGKSTVTRQLQFGQKKIPSEELLTYLPTLFENAAQALGNLIEKSKDESGLYKVEADNIRSQLSEVTQMLDIRAVNQDFTKEEAAKLYKLWKSDYIQSVWDERATFWHLEATPFYLDNVERFASDGFVPNLDDVMYSRQRTTGIRQIEIERKPLHYTVVDVGGQRSERRKWINCFDNVKAIVFVANLAGYSTVLFEDNSLTRMIESLNLFEKTLSNENFAGIPVYLFLNKKDLFEEYLRAYPLKKAFPEYEGGDSVHDAIAFIENEYQKRLPAGRENVKVFAISARYKKDVSSSFTEMHVDLQKRHEATIAKSVAKLAKFQKTNIVE